MNKVYVVCEPSKMVAGQRVATKDLSPASAWGEVVVLLQTNQSTLNSEPTVDLLYQRLKNFNDDDYLIPIGDPILMCMAMAVAAEQNDGRVNLLKWDRIQCKYLPILVNVR